MKRFSPIFSGWFLVLAVCFLGCQSTKTTVSLNPPACYLTPGPYHMVAKLMVSSGCQTDKVPAIIVNSLDVVHGQLKCGLVSAPLASGAIMMMKVKPDMIVGRLVVSDGKCHIEYGILILPKAEKQK